MLLLDPNLPPALAEARLLHPRAPDNTPGYFTVARVAAGKWSEKSYNVDLAEPVMRALAGSPDAYVSQATFVSRRRASSLAHTLRCAFVDLDLYNLDLIADDASIKAVMEHARRHGVPEPSLIVSSGRGLYAKWIFDQPITSTLMPQWNALQASLIALYTQFGCDPKVRDAARVLRPASSINSKTGSEVKVVLDTGRTWSFVELCEQVGTISVAATMAAGGKVTRGARERQHKLLGACQASDLGQLVNYSALREPVMMRQMSVQSLNWARFLDLRDLALARGGFARGSRDSFLFWMVCFLGHSGVITPENFWPEVGAVLQAFPLADDFQPATDGSLGSLKKRLEAAHAGKFVYHQGARLSPIYTPSNDHLLNLFQITADEEHRLRTVISGAERLRRADLKVPGRAERRSERQESRAAAIALFGEGTRIEDIAATVGRSTSTVYRWLAAGKSDSDADPVVPKVEKRGRRSPYAVHQQQLPRSRSGPAGPRRTEASPPKVDRNEMTDREMRRRGRLGPAQPPPILAGVDLADWVESRLEQIRLRSASTLDRRKANQRLERAAADAENAQAQLRMHLRLMRIIEHVRRELPPSGLGIEPARLKSGARLGRLSSLAPPASAPPSSSPENPTHDRADSLHPRAA